MKKSQRTKTKLLSSLVLLLLSMTMFLGTTFAWFTDSVTSASNVIKSGNLDVKVEYTLDGENWKDLDGADDIFENALWEPGHTRVVALKVSNVGSLALKYNANMNIVEETVGKNKEGGDIVLSDILTVGTLVQEATQIGDIALALAFEHENMYKGTTAFKASNILEENKELFPGSAHYVIIKVDMAETVGNEANHNGTNVPSINFGINVVATQYSFEEDSFGKDYDANAEFPVLVSSAEELQTVLTNGGNVQLGDNLTINETMKVEANAEVTIDLNGHNIESTVDNNGKASAIFSNAGTLNLKGKGTLTYVASDPDMQTTPGYATNTISNFGTLTIGEGVTVYNGSNGGASYAVDNHGIFHLNGGTLKATRTALRVAKYNPPKVEFVMNGGTIEGSTPVWIQLPSNDSSVAPEIKVTVNDGLIQTTKTSSEDNNIFYTYSYGNSHANTSITINGGEFLGGTVSIGSGYKGDSPSLTINGGTFEYNVIQWLDGSHSVLYSANK